MTTQNQNVAQQCLTGAEHGTLTFPQIVARLTEAGFDGYLVDFRTAKATYYPSESEAVALTTHRSDVPVAASFDSAAVESAIREAQALVPGYTYQGFCDKVKRAGCAGYLVSILGRRVLYFGRSAETHVEHFPR